MSHNIDQKFNEEKSFGFLRSIFFPIHKEELKKFLSMLVINIMLMMCLQIISAIKSPLSSDVLQNDYLLMFDIGIFVGFPLYILSIIFIIKLINMFGVEKLFYIVFGFFLAFFVIFALVIYPNMDLFLLSMDSINRLEENMGEKYYRFIKILATFWPVLFLVMSNVFTKIMVPIIFWMLANEITSTNEAKRFYPLLIVSSYLSLLSSEVFVDKLLLGSFNPQLLGFVLLTCGSLALYAYHWVYNNVIFNKNYHISNSTNKIENNEEKLGVVDTFTLVFSSSYVRSIFLLVLFFVLSFSIVEITWKKQIMAFVNEFAKEQIVAISGNNIREFNKLVWSGYNNLYIFDLQLKSLFIVIIGFLSHILLRRFGWFYSALTPIFTLLFIGLSVFGVAVFKNYLYGVVPILSSMNSYDLIIKTVGVFIAIAAALKYVLFTTVKEMLYIPLPSDLKAKSIIIVAGFAMGMAKFLSLWIFSSVSIFAYGTFMLDLIYLLIVVASVVLLIAVTVSIKKEYNNMVTNIK